MAPGYRANGPSSRRNNRTYVDHDVFEGLPVRQWRRDTVHVVPPPPLDSTNNQTSIWDVELPWGMPKDSHLLPQHSQDLLRAARSGRIDKRPAPPEDEEVDPDLGDAAKTEKKDSEDSKDVATSAFVAKTWKQVPRHLEGPDIDYLAKRRKVLSGAAVKNGPHASDGAAPAPSNVATAAPATTVTKATVLRVDAEGKTYTQDVVVPHGEKVEGEVISQVVIVEDAGGQQAPASSVKKRPPPPAKRRKGPGRGRKKKAEDAPGIAAIAGNSGQPVPQGADGQPDNQNGHVPGPNKDNEDIEMGDASGSRAGSEDEGEDGDDAENGNDDDNDEEEGEMEEEAAKDRDVEMEDVPSKKPEDSPTKAGPKTDTGGRDGVSPPSKSMAEPYTDKSSDAVTTAEAQTVNNANSVETQFREAVTADIGAPMDGVVENPHTQRATAPDGESHTILARTLESADEATSAQRNVTSAEAKDATDNQTPPPSQLNGEMVGKETEAGQVLETAPIPETTGMAGETIPSDVEKSASGQAGSLSPAQGLGTMNPGEATQTVDAKVAGDLGADPTVGGGVGQASGEETQVSMTGESSDDRLEEKPKDNGEEDDFPDFMGGLERHLDGDAVASASNGQDQQ